MEIASIRKKFLQFWKSENKHISLIRDIAIALFTVLLILLILWSYTGQWLSAPIVAIESGSMEHSPPAYATEPSFGRLGTIDAGDMVLVQKVYSRNDIAVHGGDYGGAQSVNGWQTYGDYGDVIIFYPDGDKAQTPIIHRAMCWVDVRIDHGTHYYTIEEFNIINQTHIPRIPELGLKSGEQPNWDHSGYLTKGDHNDLFDNLPNNGIQESTQPIKLEWISGKARFEIPWFGTINLFFSDLMNGTSNVSNVHGDSLICLGIVIAILISLPILFDIKDYIKDKKQQDSL